jgi:hypothetical protein
MSVWLCFGRCARAQPVVLDLSACEEAAPNEVRALLELELHERLVKEAEAPPANAQTVQVSCLGGEAQLALRDTQLRRTVALSSVPAALRARLLALAVAELTRPQALPAPPALAAPTKPRPVPPPAAAPVAEPPAYLLWLGVEVQASPLLGPGAALLLRMRICPWLAWANAVSFAQAYTAIDRGELRVRNFSLRSGPALLLESERVSLQIGIGARAGLMQLQGEPSDLQSTAASSFDAWYVGPALFAEVSWTLGAHVFIALGLEADHGLRRVRANVQGGQGRTLSALRSSATLGAGVAW